MSGRHPLRRIAGAAALLLSTLAGAAGAQEAGAVAARFRVEAGLTTQEVSHDGRYALHAAWSGVPRATSDDGRYAVSVAKGAGCGPLPDLIFADDFNLTSVPAG